MLEIERFAPSTLTDDADAGDGVDVDLDQAIVGVAAARQRAADTGRRPGVDVREAVGPTGDEGACVGGADRRVERHVTRSSRWHRRRSHLLGERRR